jgi:hypothetical protein
MIGTEAVYRLWRLRRLRIGDCRLVDRLKEAAVLS